MQAWAALSPRAEHTGGQGHRAQGPGVDLTVRLFFSEGDCYPVGPPLGLGDPSQEVEEPGSS